MKETNLVLKRASNVKCQPFPAPSISRSYQKSMYPIVEAIMKTTLRIIKFLLMPLAVICVAAEAALPAKADAPTEDTQSFLFIGNSFTMRHQLPTLFAALAHEGFPGSSVKTEIVGYGGKNLFQHWECYRSYNRLNLSGRSESDLETEIRELTILGNSNEEPDFYKTFSQGLSDNAFYRKFTPKTKSDWEGDRSSIRQAVSRHKEWLSRKATDATHEFDFVVLQSWLDVTDDPSTGYFKYAAMFSDVAKASGARPVLYLTASYAHNQIPTTQAVARERAVGECRAALAFSKTTGAIVVPVPLTITLAQESVAPVARTLTFRYLNDGHPNHTMAYLTACTFYAAVFGKSPEGLLFSKVTENKSQNIHGEAVRVDENTKDLSSLVNPDGGPLEKVFTENERRFLQRTAWQAVEAFRKGEF